MSNTEQVRRTCRSTATSPRPVSSDKLPPREKLGERTRSEMYPLSFRGVGSAREPGIQEHGPMTPKNWLVFMDSGPAPSGHPGKALLAGAHRAALRFTCGGNTPHTACRS